MPSCGSVCMLKSHVIKQMLWSLIVFLCFNYCSMKMCNVRYRKSLTQGWRTLGILRTLRVLSQIKNEINMYWMVTAGYVVIVAENLAESIGFILQEVSPEEFYLLLYLSGLRTLSFLALHLCSWETDRVCHWKTRNRWGLYNPSV